MDFSNIPGNGWGTDQISSTNPLNYTTNDMFVTEKVVTESLAWPATNNKYTVPKVNRIDAPTVRAGNKGEHFIDMNGNLPKITENMIIILLLVILVVLCTMIYSTVKQTCEMMKIMLTVLASSK